MKKALLFTAGVISGFCLGCLASRNRYEKIMEEDRRSRKEVQERKRAEKENEKEEVESCDPVPCEEEKEEYKEKISELKYGFIDDSNEYERIPVHELDSEDGYATVELTVYANEIVCDDADDPMSPDEVKAAIGDDKPWNMFDEDDNEIYVRNHERKLDYIVVLSEECYEE